MQIDELTDKANEILTYVRILKNSLQFEELDYDYFVEDLYSKFETFYDELENYSIKCYAQHKKL